MSGRRRFLKRSGLAAGALVVSELLRMRSSVRAPDDHPLLATPFPGRPDLTLVRNVDPQPLIAHVNRVLGATASLGAPLNAADQQALKAAFTLAGATQAAALTRAAAATQAAAATEVIQRVLDRSCLVGVQINPEMRVKVAPGPARPELVEGRWRPFLVKVHNEAGTTAALRATDELAHYWLDLLMFDHPPLPRTLSGVALEYRIVRLYSREAGRREASLAFDVGQGTQDLGFRNEVPILFDCRPISHHSEPFTS